MKYELDKNEIIKVLTRNAIKCLVCNTVLESKHQHHFVECGKYLSRLLKDNGL